MITKYHHTDTTVKPLHKERIEKPKALDFFAGSGLAAKALSPFFSVVWANDISEKKAAVYLSNHSRKTFHLENIRNVRGSEVPSAFLSWASFPCQDLSLAGNQEGINSARSGLVWEWLRIMDEMPRKPPVLVAENVMGLLSADDGKHYLSLHNALKERGYRVGAIVLDAIKWLPQSRPRVFVIAVRRNLITTTFETEIPIWCHNSIVQRIARKADGFVWWALPEPRTTPKPLSDIIEFDAPTHNANQSRRNLRLIPSTHRRRMRAAVNGNRAVFPGYKRIRNGQQVLELRFDNIAGCLRTPEGGSSRQFVVIYRHGDFATRLLTIREAARLMGAPDGYRIVGTYNDGYKAMGDAVAVPVVRYLARHLLVLLAESMGL
jgi:DNA (cytosine-5)-methyltransferase 1